MLEVQDRAREVGEGLCTFLRRQEVLLSPKDKLSRVVANYPVLEV